MTNQRDYPFQIALCGRLIVRVEGDTAASALSPCLATADFKVVDDERARGLPCELIRRWNAHTALREACERLLTIETRRAEQLLGRDIGIDCTYCLSIDDHATSPSCPVNLARAALALPQARKEEITK